ncbi:MAG: hypothetical protein GX878_00430, partial [Firmicutes bacterium]|nr:hypothetical protein [Bacillota bacterium]
YIQTREAFAGIYNCYLTLSCCSALDDVAIRNTLQNLREALGKLRKPATDFEELAALPAFRALIPASDAGYARFVRTVPLLTANGPDFAAEKERIKEEFEQTLALLSGEKAAVKSAGRANLAKVRRSQVLAVAPHTKAGSYSYMEEEVTGFE